MSLTSIAPEGKELETLKELRDDLAARMDLCSSDQNYSTMARVFADTLARISALEGSSVTSGGTALDELAKRRAAKGRPNSSNAIGSARSTR